MVHMHEEVLSSQKKRLDGNHKDGCRYRRIMCSSTVTVKTSSTNFKASSLDGILYVQTPVHTEYGS
jgi:hypothetical protein